MASRLPKPSGLKPPQSRRITRSMGSIPDSPNYTLVSEKPRYFTREAKKTQSCKKPESKPIGSKNNPPRKGLGSNNPTSTIVGKAKISAAKRRLTLTISKGEEQPKPKMEKKIPDCDWKGRFYQLNEEYQEFLKEIKLIKLKISELEVSHAETQEKLTELDENLNSKLTTLQKKYRQLEADFKILEENNKKLLEEKVFISRIYNLK